MLPRNLGSGDKETPLHPGSCSLSGLARPLSSFRGLGLKKTLHSGSLSVLESGADLQPLPPARGASSAPCRVFPTAQDGGRGGFWRFGAVRGV